MSTTEVGVRKTTITLKVIGVSVVNFHQNLIYRDLKVENLLLDEHGDIKIIDEEPPVKESRSNAMIENTIRIEQGQIRAMSDGHG